jgi:hypothetical protein
VIIVTANRATKVPAKNSFNCFMISVPSETLSTLS